LGGDDLVGHADFSFDNRPRLSLSRGDRKKLKRW
jgi:hypothetical protein